MAGVLACWKQCILGEEHILEQQEKLRTGPGRQPWQPVLQLSAGQSERRKGRPNALNRWGAWGREPRWLSCCIYDVSPSGHSSAELQRQGPGLKPTAAGSHQTRLDRGIESICSAISFCIRIHQMTRNDDGRYKIEKEWNQKAGKRNACRTSIYFHSLEARCFKGTGKRRCSQIMLDACHA